MAAYVKAELAHELYAPEFHKSFEYTQGEEQQLPIAYRRNKVRVEVNVCATLCMSLTRWQV
jgi:hypothetical protein